jgi:hypothetical protein
VLVFEGPDVDLGHLLLQTAIRPPTHRSSFERWRP